MQMKRVPVIGHFDRPERTKEWPEADVCHTPIAEFLDGQPLKEIAIRHLDGMTQRGDGMIRHWIAAKWLVLAGYIECVAFRKDHPLFGDYIYEPTVAGLAFHRANAAPVGEW